MPTAKIADATPDNAPKIADATPDNAPPIADATLKADIALVLACIDIAGDKEVRTAAQKEARKEAQKQLVDRHHENLLRFFRNRASPVDFEDLQHDVWAIVLNKDYVDRIQRIKTSVRSYIYGIARNVLYNHYNKRKREFDPITSSIELFDATLSRQAAERHDAETLHEAMAKLPIDDQVLLHWRYSEGMSTVEMAEAYDVPVGTIKSRLHTARQALDKRMQPKKQ